MNRNIHISLIAAAVVLASSLSTARAADEVIGIFAKPNCKVAKEVLVKTRFAGMWLNAEYAYLFKIKRVVSRRGWRHVEGEAEADSFFIQTRPDGTLVVPVEPQPKTGKGVKKADPDGLPTDKWVRDTFRRCDALPLDYAGVHSEGVAVLLAIGPKFDACRDDQAGRCLEAAFGVADVSGDKALSSAELARVVRAAAYFGVASDVSSSTKDLTAAVAWTHAAGPLLGRVAIANYDYDDDGRLSLAEITQDREGMFGGEWHGKIETADRASVKKALGQLKNLPDLLMQFMR